MKMVPKFGQSAIVEDFVPVSNSRALVTTGPGFRNLTTVVEVDWHEDGECLILDNPTVIRTGEYLRLGHYASGGGLIYSDGFEGPHQPHFAYGHIYWTNDAPNGRIYRDGKLFIDHWSGIAEIGNPWATRDAIYFEARNETVAAPDGWWVWRAGHDGKDMVRVCQGANPCVFKETLFYCAWNGSSFDVAKRQVV